MISKSRKLKGNSSSRLETKLSPKSILPHLHVKTHFKAATTFTLAYPGSFYCPATTSIGKAIENMKTDKEKLSVRNLFNTFKNIEFDRVGAAKTIKQDNATLESQDVNISKVAKNILTDCNVFRRKTNDIQQEINSHLRKKMSSQLKLRNEIQNKNVKFRDHNDPYFDKSKRKMSKQPEAISIDDKFISSDDESGIGKVAVKKIKVHPDNIFLKSNQNVSQKKEDQNTNQNANESSFHID